MHRLLATAALCALATAGRAEFTLTILHTNDVHDRFEPINAFDSTCDAEADAAGECFGGVARLATALRAAEAEAVNPILLDAGDQFQGSLLFTLYQGAMSAEFMPRLGYDAMAAGNHEFDLGPGPLGDFAAAVGLPLLSANVDAGREPLLAGRLAPSTVLEVGGERVGVVGLTTADMPEIASPGPNVAVAPYAAAQAAIDALEAEGVDKIVLLTHVGYAVDLRLAASLDGVDVIVGGHSHSLLGDMEGTAGPYPTMVGDVPVVQARSYGKYLGRLVVTFDDAGRVVSAEGAPILLDASVAEDEAIRARVAELGAPLEALRAEVVGEAAAAIEGAREVCRVGECAMGNLVADAMLARVADQGVTVALANSGGLRASIDAGPVTRGEVLTVLPFQNTLSTFSVSGATLAEALENGASQIEEGAGRFLQVAGLRYAVDPAAPAGARVSGVEVRLGGDAWAPLDPAATYLVVSNNYVRQGGDGFAMFEDAADAYDFGPDLADVVAEFIAANSPYEPYTDGRVTVR